MSTIKTDTLQNVAGTLSVPVGTVVNGSAKAWVNFNGTGTVAIRAGFNVSSITDIGVGEYVLNFTTAMSDSNYCVSTGGLQGSNGVNITSPFVRSLTTTTCTVHQGTTGAGGGGQTDSSIFCVSIFR